MNKEIKLVFHFSLKNANDLNLSHLSVYLEEHLNCKIHHSLIQNSFDVKNLHFCRETIK